MKNMDSMDELEEITALVLEGRRRGLSYGKLVSATTEAERDDIIRKYRLKKKKKDKRSPAE